MAAEADATQFSRQESLLQAAAVAFAQRGYEETTVRHLEEATGVERGSLFLDYPGKRDLYLATLHHVYVEALVPHVARAVNESLVAVEVLPTMFQAMRSWHAAHPEGIVLFRQLDAGKVTDPDLAEFYEHVNHAMDALFGRLFGSLQQRGVLNPRLDPAALTSLFHRLMDESFERTVGLPDEEAEAFVAPLFQIVIEGIRP